MTIVRWTNRGTAEVHAPRPAAARLSRSRTAPARRSSDWDHDDRGPRRNVLGAAAALPAAPFPPRRLRRRRAWTRPGTGTSGMPRRPRAATTPRKTSGARSNGSGRCGRTRRRSPSSLSRRSRATPTSLFDAERRRRDNFARTGDPVFDEMARRAEVLPGGETAGARHHPGRLPVAFGLGAAGDDRGARARARARPLRRGLAQVLNTSPPSGATG